MAHSAQSELLAAIKSDLVGKKSGVAEIVDVDIEQLEDSSGMQVWGAVLYLTPPPGGAWAVDDTRILKRAAREVIETESTRLDVNLDGIPSISLSARDTPLDDLAPDELPEDEEVTDETADAK